MHEYFKSLIASDPKNAVFYEIFLEHYRCQTSALNKCLQETMAATSELAI
jgi:ABC-type Zn uptake system ZnuABC Zn-binding protein ZnuA